MSQSRFTPETARLDDAARAGWLYYVAGNTQDEIARKLGVSRQSAQRLVSLAVSEKLVKVRLDHPIARCMDLSGALAERYNLRVAEVVPSDPTAPELMTGIAIAAAAELEKLLKSPEEKIIALGTGRALRACVEQLPRMDCPQHRIVSRLGNMMSDGSATPYNAVIRMAERVGAKHYPYPLPVRARDEEELRVMHSQEPVRHTMELCARADFTLVGVGQVGANAPIHLDGFLDQQGMDDLIAQGVVGEITSWVYDAEGRVLDNAFNRRVASAPLPVRGGGPVVGLAAGPGKADAIRAALRGRLIDGLITDEATAERLLKR
ncbi:sugar-binding transcriptional regulator [Limimaricola hongkongensis]|uniref:Transcriptional regulator of mannitol utilization, DeoR family protein n=1 Tax=Limimaricola hongkongensis DSM 17492 TaxID=1122180 RepID=A0A017HC28_9RHOB|nr:sugar-binding transcriptional regulator [Limimaricola hongkongensis]EYD71344.1 Transcriptional regulator of mannitol utilization, DeoR family protein [Limimaricola hongkongensis DSM 17492]